MAMNGNTGTGTTSNYVYLQRRRMGQGDGETQISEHFGTMGPTKENTVHAINAETPTMILIELRVIRRTKYSTASRAIYYAVDMDIDVHVKRTDIELTGKWMNKWTNRKNAE